MLCGKNITRSVFLFLVAVTFQSAAQRAKGGHGTTISLGPVLGFYKLDSRHAVAPARKTSLVAGIRREIRADREYRTFIQFGAEYFIHGLNYSSYFFTQDTLQLYDRSFG